MSDRIAPIPFVTPLTNHPEASPPTSTGQTDSRLTSTNTSTHVSDSSEPTVSNKVTPQSPLDATADSTKATGLILEHSEPELRDQSLCASSSTASKIAESQIKHKNSIDILKEAALSGDVAAQFNLGMCYYSGDGVEKDPTQASIYFQLAAAEGDADAQFNLGTMYLNGEGVEKDANKAVIWYGNAARQSHADAQYNLGLMYHLGDGVPRDDAKAVNYFRDSAQLGLSDSQCQLGLMYEKGLGVERDEKKAFDWYLEAANNDNANAQFEVGRMYADGSVVAKDDDQALAWLTKAAQQGLDIAQLALVGFLTNSSKKNIDINLASY